MQNAIEPAPSIPATDEYHRALYELRLVAEGVGYSFVQPGEGYVVAAQRIERTYGQPAPITTVVGSDMMVLLLRHMDYIRRLESGEAWSSVVQLTRPTPQYGPARRRPA